MNWRPSDWAKIKHEVAIGTDSGGLCEGCEELVDAMLEALKKDGVSFFGSNAYLHIGLHIGDRRWKLQNPGNYKGGTVVIIPDEGE